MECRPYGLSLLWHVGLMSFRPYGTHSFVFLLVFYEPTDVVVAPNLFHSSFSKSVKYISPNINGLKFIANYLGLKLSENYADILSEALEVGKLVAEFVDTVFITLRSQGLIIIRKGSANDPLMTFDERKNTKIQIRHYMTKEIKQLVNVSGAGNCLASGIIFAMLSGYLENIFVSVGFAAAQMALQCRCAVPAVLFDKINIFWIQRANFIQL